MFTVGNMESVTSKQQETEKVVLDIDQTSNDQNQGDLEKKKSDTQSIEENPLETIEGNENYYYDQNPENDGKYDPAEDFIEEEIFQKKIKT